MFYGIAARMRRSGIMYNMTTTRRVATAEVNVLYFKDYVKMKAGTRSYVWCPSNAAKMDDQWGNVQEWDRETNENVHEWDRETKATGDENLHEWIGSWVGNVHEWMGRCTRVDGEMNGKSRQEGEGDRRSREEYK
ncbi:hypothetical protein B0H16DRAFT_1470357 [Mycena metata]|uniref:Uncharacterized protein n=1 Tax=Mycena metata TaxID=1033252 RepID=A0AAD7HUQ1_9AGAR|nr:hypothetical protein B0H16DRAFT_1470357 [Mycena metata]